MDLPLSIMSKTTNECIAGMDVGVAATHGCIISVENGGHHCDFPKQTAMEPDMCNVDTSETTKTFLITEMS